MLYLLLLQATWKQTTFTYVCTDKLQMTEKVSANISSSNIDMTYEIVKVDNMATCVAWDVMMGDSAIQS